MDLTPHLIAGAALAVRVKRPAPALILAFVSHFVLDTIPHFDIAWVGGEALPRWIDVGLGLLLLTLISWRANQLWPLAGAAAGVLPDAPGLRETLETWASVILPHSTWYPPGGVWIEIIVTSVALVWAVYPRPLRSTP